MIIPALSLAILGAFFLNLPLQLGIGSREIFLERDSSLQDAFFETVVLFISLLIQWILWTLVFTPLSLGFLKYFLLLPLNVVIPAGINIILYKIQGEKITGKPNLFSFPAKAGAGIAAMILILNLASSWTDALVLAASFSFGILFSVLTLRAIRFRVNRERVSPLLRGIPMLLIAMGLLSLALYSAALIYLR